MGSKLTAGRLLRSLLVLACLVLAAGVIVRPRVRHHGGGQRVLHRTLAMSYYTGRER